MSNFDATVSNPPAVAKPKSLSSFHHYKSAFRREILFLESVCEIVKMATLIREHELQVSVTRVKQRVLRMVSWIVAAAGSPDPHRMASRPIAQIHWCFLAWAGGRRSERREKEL
jgi:hypothetical protein